MFKRMLFVLILGGSIVGCAGGNNHANLSQEQINEICQQDGYKAGKEQLPYDGLCRNVNSEFVARYQLGQENKPSFDRYNSQRNRITSQTRYQSSH